jgi:hypothetical protein
MILNDKAQARIKAYEGPVHPMLFNKIGRHAWWDSRDDDKVMVHWRAGLPPPAKRVVSMPRAAPKPMDSSSSSRLATSCHTSSFLHASSPPRAWRSLPKISFCAPKKEEPMSPPHRNLSFWPSTKTKPGPGARIKMEPGTIKLKLGTVNLELSDMKPETTSPLPPSPEPLHAKYAFIYRSNNDGEWIVWQDAIQLSVGGQHHHHR